MICCIFIFSNQVLGNEGDGNYALVFYSNPNEEFIIPFNAQQVLQLSDHKLFIGNEKVLTSINEYIKRIKTNRNSAKSGYPGYFLSMVLYKNSIVQYKLYIQRDRSFLLMTHEKDINGVMSEEQFNDFVSICENIINVIDYNYQWERLK